MTCAAAVRLRLSSATGARWAHQVMTKDHAEAAPRGPPCGEGRLAPNRSFPEELSAQRDLKSGISMRYLLMMHSQPITHMRDHCQT
jgi:hypothetical protein